MPQRDRCGFAEAVLALLGFAALNYSAYLLALTLFVAFCCPCRAYRDSEMVVWFSSGVSLTAWVRPVLVFGAAGSRHRRP